MKRTVLLIALVLGLAGVIKQPFERSLAADNPSWARGSGLDVKMREQIGQGLSMALLGGFRALVADLLWIAAQAAWEEGRWFTMQQRFEVVTLLQPQATFFWDLSSWHLAWNASHAARFDPTEPRLAVRIRNQRLWMQAGKRLLERGIANNPDNFLLHERMAWLLHDKLQDICGSADYALAAVKRCKGWQLGYLQRLAGYWLEECARGSNSARMREAYDYWRHLWLREYNQKPREQWDTIDKNLSRRITKFEDDLAIPDSERLFTKIKTSDTVAPH